MITPDGREIMFAGAGILWGATTFFRGLRIRLAGHAQKRSSGMPLDIIAGVVLAISCSAYLVWSVRDSF